MDQIKSSEKLGTSENGGLKKSENGNHLPFNQIFISQNCKK